MRVEFTKREKNGRVACEWIAIRGKRTVIPGAYMPAGKDIPHDLGQYVVEASTGTTTGFWGLLRDGATFKSTGRRRTEPGRAIIRDHRADLDAAEVTAEAALTQWRTGAASKTADALNRALAQWRSLEPGDQIAFTWPSPVGEIVRASDS